MRLDCPSLCHAMARLRRALFCLLSIALTRLALQHSNVDIVCFHGFPLESGNGAKYQHKPKTAVKGYSPKNKLDSVKHG
jgi:hypothetical protein